MHAPHSATAGGALPAIQARAGCSTAPQPPAHPLADWLVDWLGCTCLNTFCVPFGWHWGGEGSTMGGRACRGAMPLPARHRPLPRCPPSLVETHGCLCITRSTQQQQQQQQGTAAARVETPPRCASRWASRARPTRLAWGWCGRTAPSSATRGTREEGVRGLRVGAACAARPPLGHPRPPSPRRPSLAATSRHRVKASSPARPRSTTSSGRCSWCSRRWPRQGWAPPTSPASPTQRCAGGAGAGGHTCTKLRSSSQTTP